MVPFRHSIVAKYVTVCCLSLLAVSTVGIWVGSSLISDMAALNDDTLVLEALTLGRDSLIQWKNVRQKMVESVADQCLKSGDWPRCDFGGIAPHTLQPVPLEGTQLEPGWSTDSRYVVTREGQSYPIEFQWNTLKPQYQTITEVLNTHEHLAQVFPRVRQSFIVVFSLAVGSVGFLWVIAVYVMSRKIRRRVYRLTAYARQLAKGKLLVAPPESQSLDEIGILAKSMAQMAQDLYQAQERLLFAEKIQSWQTIARKIAHEIKNPLTPITLVAEQLQRSQRHADPKLKEVLGESSRILLEESESLRRMVREFTAFARLPEPKFEIVDLNSLVRDFINRNQWEGGPLYRLNSAPQTSIVMADQGMLRQVLHNLVNNAVLAKSPNIVSITFSFSPKTSPRDSKMILDIADDGPGVPTPLLQNLFDAYVTSRSTGDFEKGMGLGLTISRKIISDHQGTLRLLKTDSAGTVFRIELPLTQQILERSTQANS